MNDNVHNIIHNAKLLPLSCVIHNRLKRSQFCIMNDIVNDKKGHTIVNDKIAALLISQTDYF